MTEQQSKYSIAVITLLCVSFTSCSFSTKSIYYEQEQLVAERAVSEFHDLHNNAQFEAIYELMDKAGNDNESRARILADIKMTFETVGKVKSSKLVEKKVFPSPVPGFSSQVKLAYDTQFEKGDWMEFFAWNIKNSGEAVLAEYKVSAKNPESNLRK